MVGIHRATIVTTAAINMILNAIKLTGLCLLAAALTALVVGGLVAFMVFGTIFLGGGPY